RHRRSVPHGDVARAADLSAGSTTIDPVRRRAAIIASAVTVPFVVVLALVIGNATSSNSPSGKSSTAAGATDGPLPAITVAAPPANPAADSACTKVLAALPV